MFASDLMQESHKSSLPLAKDVANKRAYEKGNGLRQNAGNLGNAPR